MEGGENNGLAIGANDNHAFVSDNISFNSSSISIYSAEEQIIQQRGRKSPIKNSLYNQYQLQHNQHEQHLQQPQAQHHSNEGDLLTKSGQTTSASPDSKTSSSFQQDLSQCSSSNDFSELDYNDFASISCPTNRGESISKRVKRNLNKSFLRTPVKRRLKLRLDSRRFKKLQRRL